MQKHELKVQCIRIEPLREFLDGSQQQSQQVYDSLVIQLRILESRSRKVRKKGKDEVAPAAQELILVARVVIQLVAQVLDVEEIGPRFLLHVGELRLQQALDRAARRDRGEAAHRVGILVENASGNFVPSSQRLELVRR